MISLKYGVLEGGWKEIMKEVVDLRESCKTQENLKFSEKWQE